MATDFSQLDALYPLPPDELPRQWVLTRDEARLPDDWQRYHSHGWHLCAHPLARVSTLKSRDGRFMGWGIEVLLQLKGEAAWMPGEEVTLPVGADAAPQEVEHALYDRTSDGGITAETAQGIEGPWTSILFAGEGERAWQRLYLGPTHSVVYSPTRQAVATTHNLIPGLERDEALSRDYDPLASNGFYAFGLTAFKGLHRLLPNHYLDLASLEPVRHWPLEPPERVSDGRIAAAELVDHSRRLVRGLLQENNRLRISLSAGNDSRAILAVTRPLIESEEADVRLFTSYGNDLASRVDLHAAQRLAKIAGLPHAAVKRRPQPSRAQGVQRMFVRVGESFAGPILSARRLHEPPEQLGVGPEEEQGFHLPGMGGDAGRAHYWNDGRGLDQEPTPKLLCRRIIAPATEPVLAAAQRWLDGLPAWLREGGPDLWDLAYIEHRLGGWQSPSVYLFPGRLLNFNVMTAARFIEMVLRLPIDYRQGGSLQRDMIAHGWPELLSVPINQSFGILGWRSRLRQQYHRVQNRLRRLRGRLSSADAA